MDRGGLGDSISHVERKVLYSGGGSMPDVVAGIGEYDEVVAHITPDIDPDSATTVGIRMSRSARGRQLRGASGGCFADDEVRFVAANISNPSGDLVDVACAMVRIKGGTVTYHADRKVAAIVGVHRFSR